MICLYYVEDLVIFTQNVVKITSLVRKRTVGAILESLFIVSEITAASVPESIERAVTEKAVEILHVLHLMAGKEFALLMLKKLIIFRFHKTTVQMMTSVLKLAICSTIIHPLSRFVKFQYMSVPGALKKPKLSCSGHTSSFLPVEAVAFVILTHIGPYCITHFDLIIKIHIRYEQFEAGPFASL